MILSTSQHLIASVGGLVSGALAAFGISSYFASNGGWLPCLAVATAEFSLSHFVLEKKIGKSSMFVEGATAFGLGLVGGAAVIRQPFDEFSIFLGSITIYHVAEFAITAWYHPRTCSVDSFLVNHSNAYTVAFIAGQIEYWTEKHFFPQFKVYKNTNLLHFVAGAVIFSDFVRKLGMITAGRSFTHLVSYSKMSTHKLVTNGIYKYVRHPGYLGWFWWSILTQVLLLNPVCTVLYAAAAWKFFAERIPEEEEQLCDFFPGEYEKYRENTPTYIPGIP